MRNDKSKDEFKLAIPHFLESIKMVENDKYRVQQYVMALRALNTIYARLEMYDQLPDIKKRLNALGLEN